jgi:hypothetical protein
MRIVWRQFIQAGCFREVYSHQKLPMFGSNHSMYKRVPMMFGNVTMPLVPRLPRSEKIKTRHLYHQELSEFDFEYEHQRDEDIVTPNPPRLRSVIFCSQTFLWNLFLWLFVGESETLYQCFQS